MKKVNNDSYQKIINFIHDNPNVEETKKSFLIKYATQLYINSVENIEDENIKPF